MSFKKNMPKTFLPLNFLSQESPIQTTIPALYYEHWNIGQTFMPCIFFFFNIFYKWFELENQSST